MKGGKTYLFILLMGLCIFPLVAQKNLVPNSGFEAHKSNRNNSISNAAPWKGIATVDYYMKPPVQDSGKCKGAHSGDAYVGLRFQLKYKEFLYVKLLEKLKPQTNYHFQAWFRLLPNSPYALQHMGVVFSKNPISLNQKVDETNSLYSYNPDGLINNFEWIKLEGSYTAIGGERYITIGNFVQKTRGDMHKSKYHKPFKNFHDAYYLFDDILLTEEVDSSKISAPMSSAQTPGPILKTDSLKSNPTALSIGQTIQLKSIYFETGQVELIDDNYPELDRLVELLEKNPKLEIQINGHTDATGNEATNLKLSEARAKAVFDYLLEKGISNEIDFKGYGSQSPIADNKTEEGRRKNRRVEFVVVKN